MLEYLFGNQFVVAGLTVTITGALFAALRHVPAELWRRVQDQLIVSVEVLGTDPVFEWIKAWLASHEYMRRSRSLIASASLAGNGPQEGYHSGAQLVIFTPSLGSHFLRYRRRIVWVHRSREGIESAHLLWREAFFIRVLGRDQSVARALIEDARAAFLARDDDRIAVFRSMYDRWVQAERIVPRPLDSVVLADEEQLETIAADMRRFLSAEKWYRDRGIPYRRGYMFEGVPGAGKSSSIIALAGACKRSIYMLSLSGYGMSDQRLQDLLFQVPPEGVVVLEDVDAAFSARQTEGGLTFSGLLNAIDGIGAREGRILFVTTNHVEKLDPALIRRGRIDVRVHFGAATSRQAARLYERFHPDCTAAEAEEFGASIAAGDSMADVQGRLLEAHVPETQTKRAEYANWIGFPLDGDQRDGAGVGPGESHRRERA